jgi:ribosomal protein S18 acetylase RimI-like enzyme
MVNMGTESRIRSIPPGELDHFDQIWEFKENIRRELDIFQYDREYFFDMCTDAHIYLIFNSDKNSLIGLSIIRGGGYMSILAVAPNKRGCGIGQSLVDEILDDFDGLECHVRATNDNAIEFYSKYGFERDTVHPEYYDNDDDAIHMKI